MNIEISNALAGYIEVLYITNQKLIKLCGVDLFQNDEYLYSNLLDIIQNIPRLIPYGYNKEKERLELVNRNGLLEFKKEITYLKKSYSYILTENYEFLNDIRKIRNKYEHKIHNIKSKAASSGTTSFFDVEFEVNGESISVEAINFINLIKKLNTLFSLIVKEIVKYAEENGKTGYRYYDRISRFDFEEFNKIYDSGLIRTIGKIMLDY